jgi:NAD(P)-dependent dehydrogenase (short-subunit alcohol dehydrogenase family)
LIGRNKEKLLKVLNELNETNPGNHTIHECDITKKNHRDHTIGEVVSVHGTPDLVINNAAVIGDPKPLTEFTEEEIEKMINTNLTGTVLFTRKVILELLKS